MPSSTIDTQPKRVFVTVTANVDTALRPLTSIPIWLDDVERGCREFWRRARVAGNLEAAVAEFDRQYDVSANPSAATTAGGEAR